MKAIHVKAIHAASLLFAVIAQAEVTTIHIHPSTTDPAIKTFDSPHDIYVNRDIVVEGKSELPRDRRELLLWLTGTHIKGTSYGNGAVAFCKFAADRGYHVISLTYPNDAAAASCRGDSDPIAFEHF